MATIFRRRKNHPHPPRTGTLPTERRNVDAGYKAASSFPYDSTRFLSLHAHRAILLSLTLSLLLPSPGATADNALKHSLSPYLAMHSADPVNWHPWSADALRQARRENKLIFISSGYFSCYWCHRMHADVYRHRDAAAALNRYTLPIKIDRELNPGLDRYLIQFAQRATGRAGWPVHVLLTPEGLPFYAFMYQPKGTFIQTIERAARLWKRQPDAVRKAARKALPTPEPYPEAARLALTPAQLRQRLFQQLRQQMDDFAGGLKGQRKFPETPLLLALIKTQDLPEAIREWLFLTLDAMRARHLWDHVNGGFFRYTVDPEWHTPHYEKMLYDNAQLATLYLQAGKRFGRRDWLETGLQTLAFLENALYNPRTGLFFGSLSAVDHAHEEGGNYLWRADRLKRILTPEEFALVEKAWHLDDPGPWEGKWLPEPLAHALWPQIRAKLRRHSVAPERDDKQIIGWNALMVNAYAAAAQATDDAAWRRKARRLFDALQAHLLNADNAPRALTATGKTLGEATLEDFALLRAAAWALDLPDDRIRRSMERRFLTDTGWKLAAAPLLPGQSGEKWLEDGPLPSLTAIADWRAPHRLAAAQTTIASLAILSASYLRFDSLPPASP